MDEAEAAERLARDLSWCCGQQWRVDHLLKPQPEPLVAAAAEWSRAHYWATRTRKGAGIWHHVAETLDARLELLKARRRDPGVDRSAVASRRRAERNLIHLEGGGALEVRGAGGRIGHAVLRIGLLEDRNVDIHDPGNGARLYTSGPVGLDLILLWAADARVVRGAKVGAKIAARAELVEHGWGRLPKMIACQACARPLKTEPKHIVRSPGADGAPGVERYYCLDCGVQIPSTGVGRVSRRA